MSNCLQPDIRWRNSIAIVTQIKELMKSNKISIKYMQACVNIKSNLNRIFIMSAKKHWYLFIYTYTRNQLMVRCQRTCNYTQISCPQSTILLFYGFGWQKFLLSFLLLCYNYWYWSGLNVEYKKNDKEIASDFYVLIHTC